IAAGRGFAWVTEGFLLFRVAPLRQLLMNLAFLIAVTVLIAVPVVGFVATWLLLPALLVGPHAIARAAERGAAPEPALLAAGFRRDLAAQLRLGAVFLVAMALVLAATALVDGGVFAQAMLGKVRLRMEDLQRPEMQNAMLLGAVLQTALIGAVWFAPLLVAW